MSRHYRNWFVAIVASIAVITAGWALSEWIFDPAAPGAFYDTPSDVDTARPGTVMRSEPVADARVSGAQVSRLLYASTGLDGAPIAVSGAVIVPDRRSQRDAPVVAWAHGTTGIDPRCAPSLEARSGVGLIPQLDRFVRAGAIVVATDYPGLGAGTVHPYLVGVSEGRAILDAVRAAQHFSGDGASAPAAIYGHSQGGHATLFAAELAPTYAPELDLVGVAAMAPPTDLARLMVDDEGTASGVVLTSMAIGSWSRVYPDTPASAIVKGRFLPAVENLATRCIEDNAQSLGVAPDVAILRNRYFSRNPVTDPAWKPHFAANTARAALHGAPVLVAQGLADAIVRPAVTERYVDAQCRAGADVDFWTYANVGHFQVRSVASPAVATWILDRIAGKPRPAGCSRTARS